MANVRPGSRVYWHGVFPEPTKQGTVKEVGTVTHLVLWDGSKEPSPVWPSAVGKVLRGKPTCPLTPKCGRCP